MSRIEPVNYEQSTGKAKELLDAVNKKFGVVPNMMKTMANSPAVLEAYLNFSAALNGGSLSGKLREQIALLAAEINNCGYCAAAHTTIGKSLGLSEEDALNAREAVSTDPKTAAALKFARAILVNRGAVSEAELETLKNAGVSAGEIGEIVANVGLNVFTNYFNEVATTEIDFPRVEFPLKRAAAQA